MTAGDHGLLIKARALRLAGCAHEALEMLQPSGANASASSRLHQERALCYIDLREVAAAIAALRQAVRLNPALPACWDLLKQLYNMAGEAELAVQAARNLARLQQLPPAIVSANALHVDGDHEAAEAVLQKYLGTDPDNIGAQHLLAHIRLALGAPDDAELLLCSIVQTAPDFSAARFDLATLLLQRQKAQAALPHAQWLARHDPASDAVLRLLSATCIALGDHESVIGLHGKLLATRDGSGTDVADLRQWRANALKIAGRPDEAIADYHAALAACEDYGVAWFGLANMKTYRFSDGEIARMEAAAGRTDLADMDRIYLCFALGKALEDRARQDGRWELSWQWYARGNGLRHSSSRYCPDIAEACTARIKESFGPAAFANPAGSDTASSAPIFVVGLPRSGSTLVEQILASHPQVEGTQELTEIGRYATEICGADANCGLPVQPAAMLALPLAERRALGERYLAETRIYRRLARARFVDKMPNNFWHIGLIKMILPQAKIIDVRRAPMAGCFANLKQLFGTSNQEFTYDMDDMARHYRCYLDIMEHWNSVLPGDVIRLHYEDLVDDLEGQVRRLLEQCELEFDPQCIAFHTTRRDVRTPSAEQVRQPITRSGLELWKNYAPWLTPLHDALGDALVRYRN